MENPTVFTQPSRQVRLVPIGLLLGAALYAVWSTKAWLARAIEVQGSVIEIMRVRDRDNTGYLFTPIVHFQTADGRTIEFESSPHLVMELVVAEAGISMMHVPYKGESTAYGRPVGPSIIQV
jgi:hypothetical protein